MNDKIAAFVDGECRGVANLKYIEQTGEYLVLLTIYGEIENDKITYKVYDASTGLVYGDVSPASSFSSSKFLGSLRYMNILLDRKILAYLAFNHLSSFNLLERISHF